MLSVMGVVGAGKSTLCNILAEAGAMTLFPEPVETNPYLTKFYEEPSSYAFQMQCFLLLQRFKQTQEAQKLDQCIMDMGMHGNDIFAKLMWTNLDITDVDYETYLDMSATFKRLVKPPKLTVHLRCSPEVAISRILKRGRPAELNATNQYWYDLNREYEEWVENYDHNLLVIDVDGLDFVNNQRHREAICEQIIGNYEDA
jgi:deoxyadenosine/deoxycytidine kinase